MPDGDSLQHLGAVEYLSRGRRRPRTDSEAPCHGRQPAEARSLAETGCSEELRAGARARPRGRDRGCGTTTRGDPARRPRARSVVPTPEPKLDSRSIRSGCHACLVFRHASGGSSRRVKQWQRYLAEMFGTFILVFGRLHGILAATKLSGAPFDPAGAPQPERSCSSPPFAFGLALMAALYAFAEVSGGHFNPVVSLGHLPRPPTDLRGPARLLDLPVRGRDPGIAPDADPVRPRQRQGDGDVAVLVRDRPVRRDRLLRDLRARDPAVDEERDATRQRARLDPADAAR